MIFYNGKQFLKSIPFFNSINSQIKDVLILIESRLNKIRFTNKIKNLNIENAFDNKSIASFLHEKMKNDSVRLIPHAKQPLHIYFVGTYYDHEAHGFIQGLKQIGEITIYENADGKYGINSSSRDAEPAFVKANNNYFLQNVIETHAKKHIDFIIGTFTAPTILIETLVEIRKIGIPVVNYAMDDRLPVHWRKYKGKRRGAFGLADAVDLTLQTTKEFVPRYLAKGCASIYFPFGSDPEIFKPASEKDIDVLFIGNNYGKREHLITSLSSAGINVKSYGVGFPEGHIEGKEVPLLFSRSKIILGTGLIGHSSTIMTLKLRDFDAAMSGALYITSYNPDLIEFYEPDKEIIFYHSIAECIEKIRYYLVHNEERELIAQAGRLRAISEHTWDHRMNVLKNLLTM